MRRLAYLSILLLAFITACGSGTATAGGLETVPAGQILEILDAPPPDLVVLDVRTPEEFAEGHLASAVNVDFYAADFADQLAGLDPDVPYVLYCRSGNRSGQTLDMMRDLGFSDVSELSGGVVSWVDAGYALER